MNKHLLKTILGIIVLAIETYGLGYLSYQLQEHKSFAEVPTMFLTVILAGLIIIFIVTNLIEYISND